MSDVLTRFDGALHSLQTLREACQHSPVEGLAGRQETIEHDLEKLGRARGSLTEPLTVLLLGGTGVGKSALINALAHADIAVSSPRRPTTETITIYAHQEAHVSRLRELDPMQTTWVRHQRDELGDKVVIDAPDFDSIVQENRVLLEKILEEAEFVLVVVDREKYLNLSLYEIIRPHRSGREFGFVFNKIDHALYRTVVLEDLKGFLKKEGFEDAPVFALSADKSREDAEKWGLVPLESFLAAELDRARILRMKLLALEEILRGLVQRLRMSLSGDLTSALDGWRQDVEKGVEDLEGECLGIFAHLLSEEGPLSVVLSTYLRGVLSGPTGFGVRLVERVTGWAGTSVSGGDVDSLKLELRVAAEHVDPTVLATRLSFLHREILRSGGRAGLEEAWLEQRLSGTETSALGRELMRSVSGDLLEVFETTVERCRSQGAGRRLMLLNLPILIAGLFILAEIFRNIFVFGTGLGLLFTIAAILVLSAIPGIYLGLLWVRHQRNRAIREAKGRIREAARRALDPGVIQPVEAVVEEVGQLVSEVDNVEQVLGDLSKDVGRRKKKTVG